MLYLLHDVERIDEAEKYRGGLASRILSHSPAFPTRSLLPRERFAILLLCSRINGHMTTQGEQRSSSATGLQDQNEAPTAEIPVQLRSRLSFEKEMFSTPPE